MCHNGGLAQKKLRFFWAPSLCLNGLRRSFRLRRNRTNSATPRKIPEKLNTSFASAKEVVCMNYMTYEQTIMLVMMLIAFASLIYEIASNNNKKK